MLGHRHGLPMPRGPRGRTALRLGIVTSTALIMALAASQMRDIFPELHKDGFAQSLRQSAWTSALSDHNAVAAWPWQTVSPHMSHLPSAKVRRLGLSASFHDVYEPAAETVEPQAVSQALSSRSNGRRVVEGDIALGDVESELVGIGDSITFTASDGATCVYHVTGRPVVDPHLDLGRSGEATGESGLFDCSPLDTLLMRSPAQEGREATPNRRVEEHQRKL